MARITPDRAPPYRVPDFAVRIIVALIVLSLLGGCALSHRQQGAKLAEQGRWDEAVSAYRQALNEHPFDEDLQAELARAKIQAAEAHYRNGMQALEQARVEEALYALELAVALDPSRREHHFALADALRLRRAREQVQAAEQLTSLGRWDDALVAYERAVALDPSLTVALDGITQVTARQRASRTIADATHPITLRFQKAKLREVFEILARTAGVNVILDKDVRDDSVTMFVKDMPYDDALKLILNTHDLLAHRVRSDTLLITPNTKQKQAQYQDLMVRTFYLSNTEAKTAVSLLRSMLESKRVFADDAVNAVVVRDEPAKLHLAARVIDAIDRRQPEVVLEVEVLEVNRTKLLEYGPNYPKQASAGIVPPGFVGPVPTTAQTFTFDQLTELGPDNYLFTIPSTVTLDFFKQESQAKTIASPTLRVLNKQKATINVGDKQPILLSTTNVLPGQTATGAVPTTSTVTSIEFKDTGVKLTVEPTVHLGGDLSLKLKIEVTRVGQEVVLQENPEIKQFRFGNRMAETTLGVRDGQTVVIGGLLADERREIRVTVPWLGDLPLIGPLLSSKKTDTISTEVVLTITPRIVRRLETPGLEAQAFWSGTEGQFATSPLFVPEPQAISYPLDDRASAVGSQPKETGPTESGQRAPSTGRLPTPAASAEENHTSGAAKTAAEPEEQAAAHSPPSVGTDGSVDTPGAELVVTARGTGVLAIAPARLMAAVSEEPEIGLTASQLRSFTESVLTVRFDPQRLEFIRVVEGAGLAGTNGASGVTVGGNPQGGVLVLHLKRQPTTGLITGELVRLRFRTKAPGTSPITLQATRITDAAKVPVAVTVKPGTVVVQ